MGCQIRSSVRLYTCNFPNHANTDWKFAHRTLWGRNHYCMRCCSLGRQALHDPTDFVHLTQQVLGNQDHQIQALLWYCHDTEEIMACPRVTRPQFRDVKSLHRRSKRDQEFANWSLDIKSMLLCLFWSRSNLPQRTPWCLLCWTTLICRSRSVCSTLGHCQTMYNPGQSACVIRSPGPLKPWAVRAWRCSTLTAGICQEAMYSKGVECCSASWQCCNFSGQSRYSVLFSLHASGSLSGCLIYPTTSQGKNRCIEQ